MERRARDHRSHPVAHRQRPQGAVHDDHRVLEGHRQRGGHARSEPDGAGDHHPAGAGRGGRGKRAHRAGRRGARRTGDPVTHRRPGHHRGRGPGIRVLRRPVHLGRAGLRHHRQRDRVLHHAARRAHPGGPAHRGLADRPRRRGHPLAEDPQGPPADSRGPQQGADLLMRILVPGGAGFIGSHYVRTMLADGYPGFENAQVTVLDKLTYAGNLANLAPVADSPRFTFTRGDICDAGLLASVVPGHDAVVNFAAETHVDRSIAGAADFVAANVAGVQVLLDACLAAGVRRVVQVSTDEVYGSLPSGSWTEDAMLAPNSPYAAAKAGGDLMARAYARTHGLAVTITRCCNNYGPYQFPEKVIPLFVTNLLDGLKVPLYGDGGNVRGWIHVDDHCRGIQLVLERGEPGGVYHINGDAELTNIELARALLACCGADWGMVAHVEDRKGHDRRYSLDDSLLRSMGFAPCVPFRQGLADTVRWYQRNRRWWEPMKGATPGVHAARDRVTP